MLSNLVVIAYFNNSEGNIKQMKKISKKVLILVAVLSVFLNVFFVFHYFQEKKREKYELINAVENISHHINQAAGSLTSIDVNDPANKNHIVGATRDIAKSQGWIQAYASDMPRNLVSWIGGIEGGLGNGAYGIDEGGFRSTVQALENFQEGYNEEIYSVNVGQNPKEALKVMEDVLNSKEHMGDNYINK